MRSNTSRASASGTLAAEHVQEVLRVAHLRVGLDERQAVQRPVCVRRDHRRLGQQVRPLGQIRLARRVAQHVGLDVAREVRDACAQRVHDAGVPRHQIEDSVQVVRELGASREGVAERVGRAAVRKLAVHHKVRHVYVVEVPGQLDQVVPPDHDLLVLLVEVRDGAVGGYDAVETGTEGLCGHSDASSDDIPEDIRLSNSRYSS